MKTPRQIRGLAFGAACAVGILVVQSGGSAWAATVTWNGSTSNDWATASNWTGGATTGNYVAINVAANSPVVISTADSIIAMEVGRSANSSLTIAAGANLTTTGPPGPPDWWASRIGGAGGGTLTQTGGTATFASYFTVADDGGTGLFDLQGGTTTVNSGYVTLGQRGLGTMKISGTTTGTIFNVNTGFNIGGWITASGRGEIIQDGGTVNANGTVGMGVGTNQTGIWHLNAGIANIAGNVTNGAGSSTINIDGGTLNFTGTTIDVDTLRLGNAVGTTGAFTLASGKTLTVADLVVGNYGTGTLTQDGGTANITDLTMAAQTGSTGRYVLNGGALNLTNNLVTGSGKSNLVIDGGTLSFGSSLAVNKLYVGYASGKSGTLTLSSGQTVNVGVGSAGTEGLEIGEAGGSTGTLNVGPGATLTVSAWSRLGNGGAGTVNQSGGTVSFNGGFALSDSGGLSTYNVSGGTLNAAQITVAMRGTGNLNVSGTTAGTVLNLSSLYVGSRTTPNNSAVGTVTQDGGTVNVNGTLYMGHSSGTTGIYNLNGGVLNVATQVLDGDGTSTLAIDGGTLNLNGTSITVDNFRIGYAAGKTGSFTLAGGKTLATGELTIGNNSTASGTLTIEPGATLTATGPVTIGQTGAATVNQNGGDVTFSSYNNLANYGNTATYNLNGGTLTTTSSYLTVGQRGTAYLNVSGSAILTTYGDFNLGGFITSSGSGTVNQTGGTVDAKGNLRLGIGSGTTGIYNLQDGVLYAKTITSGAGTAIFNFTGGTLHADNVQFALTNQGGTLAPGQSAGTTLIDGAGASYDQQAPGILAIELGGYTAGTEYDVLDVAGPVTLAGSLQVSLIDGFVPVTGDTFDVVTGTDITLDPAFSLDQPGGLTAGNFFVMDVISGGPRGEILQLSLSVPEPASLLLLALGAAAVLAYGRQRRRRGARG